MTDKRFTIINTKGQWLRSDFAASYLRAMAGGCPEGGISGMGAGRTQKDQEYLHDQYLHHGGPLAAWPWYTSNHIGGTALDISTGTPAQRWLSQGSRYDRAVPGEKIRANEYGMSRTVNGSAHNEPWHFAYNPAKDKHRLPDLSARILKLGYTTVQEFQKANGLVPDGIDGPLTWGTLLDNPKAKDEGPVPPAVIPPTKKSFVVASCNMEAKRFGGGRYVDDAKFIHDTMKPDVLFTQESDQTAREQVLKYNPGMKNWPLNYVSVYWQVPEFTWGPKIEQTFDTKGVHGMVGTELSGGDGFKFTAASVHIRPTDAFGSKAAAVKGKKADIAKVIAKLAAYENVVVGGDWSSDARATMEAAGYKLATPHVDTYDKPGTQPLDGIYVKGNIKFENGKVVPTAVSDHHGTSTEVTL